MNKDVVKYLQGDDTLEFLNKISRRLSSREDCKRVEYEVTISKSSISMNPLIFVFPDTHHRADIDKMSILTFVIQSYNKEQQRLSSGTYKYECADSLSKKRRRWVKVS